ncbi:HAD-IIA family hydrolase [Brevibacterium spongiae]|uniref:HAD-IIA family hydrolase n=1 Tax=Brevibacterium spongiae TaxID=2909672 RepID=A0ABY5SNC7_9MICO|nr:HAD-IIA family hydrolase [Brevibacterium spongiae]UVI34698.1 HAD-IIA family hydrolase [Brevibacterium spongiae]
MTSSVEQAHTSNGSAPETPGVPIDCVLFDLDGVVYHGTHAIDGAADGINWLHSQQIPVNYVTNNATRTAEATAQKITGLGINATADEVTTSAQVLAERLAERFGTGARVHLVGTTGLRIALEDAGLEITDSPDAEPVAIAQGLDPHIDYETIVRACTIIRSGAEWWASNPDFSLITETGKVPGNGAFVELMARLTDTQPVIVGKPAPHMMEFATDRLGARRPLMVGDRLNTDIEGGRAAGYETALVLTGIHDIHDALRAEPQRRPTYILPNLRGLTALITGGDRSEAERVETALHEAWAAIDAGDTDAEAVLAEGTLPRTIDDWAETGARTETGARADIGARTEEEQ